MIIELKNRETEITKIPLLPRKTHEVRIFWDRRGGLLRCAVGAA